MRGGRERDEGKKRKVRGSAVDEINKYADIEIFFSHRSLQWRVMKYLTEIPATGSE